MNMNCWVNTEYLYTMEKINVLYDLTFCFVSIKDSLHFIVFDSGLLTKLTKSMNKTSSWLLYLLRWTDWFSSLVKVSTWWRIMLVTKNAIVRCLHWSRRPSLFCFKMWASFPKSVEPGIHDSNMCRYVLWTCITMNAGQKNISCISCSSVQYFTLLG